MDKECPEIGERAVSLVIECRSEHLSQLGAVLSTARNVVCTGPDVVDVCAVAMNDIRAQRHGLTSAYQRELVGETRELSKANGTVALAHARCRPAEFDRRFTS